MVSKEEIAVGLGMEIWKTDLFIPEYRVGESGNWRIRPGGRWFRDLGAGQGHLWGFVQVIKPPTLIEIHGPMFMSYAVAGHLQVRLTQISGGTELSLRHQVLGIVQDEHRQGINHGWDFLLQSVKRLSEQAS